MCPWFLASSIPVFGLESVCPRKGCPWPWPRIFFCVLGLEACVLDSTSAAVHLLQSTIVSNFFYCVECIHHTLAILPTSHIFYLCLLINSEKIISGHGSLQNSSTRFINSCKLAVRTSNITKLGTCGCGFQELRTCGCGFKNPETSLRTCGCGLSF